MLIGSVCPVRVQSMLDKNTMDTEACAEQVIRIARAGGELARVAVPGMKEAKNLQAIKARLREEGCDVPLVADVHFSPEVAEEAACRRVPVAAGCRSAGSR